MVNLIAKRFLTYYEVLYLIVVVNRLTILTITCSMFLNTKSIHVEGRCIKDRSYML